MKKDFWTRRFRSPRVSELVLEIHRQAGRSEAEKLHATQLKSAVRRSRQSSLTAVIPFHFDKTNLRLTIEDWDFESAKLIMVSDGASKKALRQVMKTLRGHPNWTLVRLPKNMGAGVARNIGFELVDTEYVVFLDVDDHLNFDALMETVQHLDQTTSDFAYTKYRRITDPADANSDGMFTRDEEIWNEVFEGASGRITTPSKCHIANLLRFTNYPWNKVYRSSFLREIPRPLFGSTPVHNDILAHWKTLLLASEIMMVDTIFSSHVRQPLNQSLTTQMDGRPRHAAIALSELLNFLESLQKNDHVELNMWQFFRDISDHTNSVLGDSPKLSDLDSFLLSTVHRRLTASDMELIRREDTDLAGWLEELRQ